MNMIMKEDGIITSKIMEQVVISSPDLIKTWHLNIEPSLGNGIARKYSPLARYGGLIQLINVDTNPNLTEKNLEAT